MTLLMITSHYIMADKLWVRSEDKMIKGITTLLHDDLAMRLDKYYGLNCPFLSGTTPGLIRLRATCFIFLFVAPSMGQGGTQSVLPILN